MEVRIGRSGLPPLKGLMDTFLGSGGKLLVCTPCVMERKMETDLIEGSELIAGARVIQEATTAAAVLNY